MPRSGTTLVDKILSMHPDAHILSQPLPLLYVHIKQRFLSELGAQRRESGYPLNDMFGENHYDPEQFESFLSTLLLTEMFCSSVLEEMVPFDGQYTKPENPLSVLKNYEEMSLFVFVRRYTKLLCERDISLIGSKETFCEEYIPYLLANGASALLVVRDPRDVIASLDYGRGSQYSGKRKPLLLNLRQWRKSAAFCLAMTDMPNCMVLKYEDLTSDAEGTMDRIGQRIGLRNEWHGIADRQIRTRAGHEWLGNSSHFESARIERASIGRYKALLPRAHDTFIQALCYPEMKALGYEVDVEEADIPGLIEGFQEESPLERQELESYRWSPGHCAEEQERWKRVLAGSYDPGMFIFEPAFQQLQAAVR
jgi:hypothetical protein